jgi:hypothetical protein
MEKDRYVDGMHFWHLVLLFSDFAPVGDNADNAQYLPGRDQIKENTQFDMARSLFGSGGGGGGGEGEDEEE